MTIWRRRSQLVARISGTRSKLQTGISFLDPLKRPSASQKLNDPGYRSETPPCYTFEVTRQFRYESGSELREFLARDQRPQTNTRFPYPLSAKQLPKSLAAEFSHS